MSGEPADVAGENARPRRRLPTLTLPRISGLAAISLGLVAAAIIGVQLGRAAIADINPIHFQGALAAPRAVDPPPEPAAYDPYAQQFRWTMGPPMLAGCPDDCDSARATRALHLALDTPAGRDPLLPVWRDATPTTELRPWDPGDLPSRGANVERYMHYQVDGEQAAPARPAAVGSAPTTPPAAALAVPLEPGPAADAPAPAPAVAQ